MFWASSCQSSGATTTAVAASSLPLELGDSSAVGHGWAGCDNRPDHDQQHCGASGAYAPGPDDEEEEEGQNDTLQQPTLHYFNHEKFHSLNTSFDLNSGLFNRRMASNWCVTARNTRHHIAEDCNRDSTTVRIYRCTVYFRI